MDRLNESHYQPDAGEYYGYRYDDFYRSGSIQRCQAGYHRAWAGEQGARQRYTADLLGTVVVVDGDRLAKGSEYEVVNGDDEKEYSACKLEVGDVDLEYVIEYGVSGEGENDQDDHADADGDVECFFALALGELILDVEKHRYVADGVNDSEQCKYCFEIRHINSGL